MKLLIVVLLFVAANAGNLRQVAPSSLEADVNVIDALEKKAAAVTAQAETDIETNAAGKATAAPVAAPVAVPAAPVAAPVAVPVAAPVAAPVPAPVAPAAPATPVVPAVSVAATTVAAAPVVTTAPNTAPIAAPATACIACRKRQAAGENVACISVCANSGKVDVVAKPILAPTVVPNPALPVEGPTAGLASTGALLTTGAGATGATGITVVAATVTEVTPTKAAPEATPRAGGLSTTNKYTMTKKANCLPGHHCLEHTIAHSDVEVVDAPGATGIDIPIANLGSTGGVGLAATTKLLRAKNLAEMKKNKDMQLVAENAKLAAEKAEELHQDLGIKAAENSAKVNTLNLKAKDNEKKEAKAAANASTAKASAAAAALKAAVAGKAATVEGARVTQLGEQVKESLQSKDILNKVDVNLRTKIATSKDAERELDVVYAAHTEALNAVQSKLAKLSEKKLTVSRMVERTEKKIEEADQLRKQGEQDIADASKKVSAAIKVQEEFIPKLKAARAEEIKLIGGIHSGKVKATEHETHIAAAKVKKAAIQAQRVPLRKEQEGVRQEITAVQKAQSIQEADQSKARKSEAQLSRTAEDNKDSATQAALDAKEEETKALAAGKAKVKAVTGAQEAQKVAVESEALQKEVVDTEGKTKAEAAAARGAAEASDKLVKSTAAATEKAEMLQNVIRAEKDVAVMKSNAEANQKTVVDRSAAESTDDAAEEANKANEQLAKKSSAQAVAVAGAKAENELADTFTSNAQKAKTDAAVKNQQASVAQ